MAVKVNKDGLVVESTGAEEFSGDPITTEQTADNASTGAEEFVAPGETVAEHIGAEVVVNDPTPGPQTTTLSWGSSARAKVIEAEASKPAPKKSSRAKTKS